MASLPPGWKADYDGQRWFFTYGPTGQSQFQFPRPGDEFPDFCCCAGAAVLPAVELMPEERLESERQVRRLLNVNGGSGAAGSTGEVVGEKGCLRGREKEEVEGRDVCFESFAAVKSRGRQGLRGGPEVTRTTEQRFGDGNATPAQTSLTDASQDSIGQRVTVPHVIKGQDAPTNLQPYGKEASMATISIVSEPVLAVVETTAAAPSLGDQGERPSASSTHSPPPELPMLDGRAVDLAHSSLLALSIEDVPELYSESTALCEDEINPPPVELPGNGWDWDEHISAPTLAIQSPVELPACDIPGARSGKVSSTVGLGSKSCAPTILSGDYAITSNTNLGEEALAAKRRGHDRAGLPSQALRMSSKSPLDKTSLRDGVDSKLDEQPPNKDDDRPAERFGTERMDLTHFPSVLRPGPRRSSQSPLQQQPGPVMPAPPTSTSQAARVRLYQLQEQQQEENVEAGSVPQGQPARMPAMPPALHPHGVSSTAPTTSHEAPRPGDVRQSRLPSSVNFVIPIQHISSAEPSPASDGSKADSPKYRVSASFAPARPPEEPPRTGGQAGGGIPGLLPGKKTESWGRAAEDQAVPSHQFVSGSRSAPGVPEWSWGYAR